MIWRDNIKADYGKNNSHSLDCVKLSTQRRYLNSSKSTHPRVSIDAEAWIRGRAVLAATFLTGRRGFNSCLGLTKETPKMSKRLPNHLLADGCSVCFFIMVQPITRGSFDLQKLMLHRINEKIPVSLVERNLRLCSR